MKLIKAIREAGREIRPVRVGRMSVAKEVETLGPTGCVPPLRVTYEATVRFQTTGPEQALLEMKRRAERAIAHEVFGELEDDLLELRKRLWEEDFYRGSQDPVLLLLHGIIDKVRGEDV